jgi:hypothetical protein
MNGRRQPGLSEPKMVDNNTPKACPTLEHRKREFGVPEARYGLASPPCFPSSISRQLLRKTVRSRGITLSFGMQN